MADHIPEEAKNFKLLGHDPSAAWGGGSIVEINKGFAYVGGGRRSSFNGPGGLHRPRRARPAQAEEGRRGEVAARRALATSCAWSTATSSM